MMTQFLWSWLKMAVSIILTRDDTDALILIQYDTAPLIVIQDDNLAGCGNLRAIQAILEQSFIDVHGTHTLFVTQFQHLGRVNPTSFFERDTQLLQRLWTQSTFSTETMTHDHKLTPLRHTQSHQCWHTWFWLLRISGWQNKRHTH